MSNIIERLMHENGVSRVTGVTKTSKSSQYRQIENIEVVTPFEIKGVTGVTDAVLLKLIHQLHMDANDVYPRKLNNINGVTPVARDTRKNGTAIVSFRSHYSFNWHLSKLKKIHLNKLSIETLEAIAMRRTQYDWMRFHMVSLASLKKPMEQKMLDEAKRALLKAGVKKCKSLEEIEQQGRTGRILK